MLANLMPALQAADTIVMLQARDALATTALVANLALVTMMFAALVILVIKLRDIQVTVKRFSGRIERAAEPIIERGREVAVNMEFISGVVRTDVQRVSDSVRSLSDRLQNASDRMEERIEEFNALMEVVQSEAEDMFIGSAAAVRGVRASARALRGAPDVESRMGEDDDGLEPDDAGPPPRDDEPAGAEARRAPVTAPSGLSGKGDGDDAAGHPAAGS